jgi:hypothetical protein
MSPILAPIACLDSHRHKSLPTPPPAPLCQTESGATAQNIGAGAGANCHSPCLKAHLPKPRSRLMLAALGRRDEYTTHKPSHLELKKVLDIHF